MHDHFNEIRIVGTDSASWFLFHPDDLAHRNQDPIDWCSYDFAVRKEFAAGTLVGVTTGGDGGFKVRLTDQELTEREKQYAVKSQSFRLRIRHGRVLIDGGYILPSESSDSVEKGSADWISIPSGDYHVTVIAVAWYDEPGAVDWKGSATKKALPSYVAVFDAVEDLTAVDIPPSLPRLDPSRPEHTFFPNPESETVEELWEHEFAILLRPEVVFPGVPQELSLTSEQHGYVERAMEESRRFSILITNQPKAQAIATLFAMNSYGSSFDPQEQSSVFSMSGHGTQIVEVIDVRKENDILWARVKPLARPSSKAGLASVAELKQRFAQYAANDPNYRKRVPYAQFHTERVAALTNPLAVGWAIASALELPADTRHQLLSAEETELIQRLNEALSTLFGS
jgi:hypothetical protein